MLFSPTYIETSRSTYGRGCGGSCSKLKDGSKKQAAWSSAVLQGTAKVYVLHVADDPDAQKPWVAPVHQPYLLGIALPAECRDLARLVTGIAFDPTRHGDQLVFAMRLLEWPLMNIRVGCTEPLRIAPPPLAQPPPFPTFIVGAQP